MNNLETTKSFMETMNQKVQSESKKLNDALSCVGIKNNSLDIIDAKGSIV